MNGITRGFNKATDKVMQILNLKSEIVNDTVEIASNVTKTIFDEAQNFTKVLVEEMNKLNKSKYHIDFDLKPTDYEDA